MTTIVVYLHSECYGYKKAVPTLGPKKDVYSVNFGCKYTAIFFISKIIRPNFGLIR